MRYTEYPDGGKMQALLHHSVSYTEEYFCGRVIEHVSKLNKSSIETSGRI